MIKRVVEISSARTWLSVKYRQLVIKEDGEQLASIPCEDIGVLLVDHQGTSYTHCVLTELLRCGAAVVLCGGNHHPAGMLLPIESNTVQTERFRQQIEVKEPKKKRLWKQVVQAKIKHQAAVVGRDSDVYKPLMTLRSRVRSGDPSNIEAQASRKYWSAYLQDVTFHRNIDGPPPKPLETFDVHLVDRGAAQPRTIVVSRA